MLILQGSANYNEAKLFHCMFEEYQKNGRFTADLWCYSPVLCNFVTVLVKFETIFAHCEVQGFHVVKIFLCQYLLISVCVLPSIDLQSV